MAKERNIEFLKKLGNSLEEAGKRMEQAYQNQRYDYFNKMKIFVAELQKKIVEAIE